ncbi:protein of unknown function [Burkholderia multivorans]
MSVALDVGQYLLEVASEWLLAPQVVSVYAVNAAASVQNESQHVLQLASDESHAILILMAMLRMASRDHGSEMCGVRLKQRSPAVM